MIFNAKVIEDQDAHTDDKGHHNLPLLHFKFRRSIAEKHCKEHDSQKIATVDQIDDRKRSQNDGKRKQKMDDHVDHRILNELILSRIAKFCSEITVVLDNLVHEESIA